MREMGWPGIRVLDEMDRRLLEQCVTKDPDGITRHAHVLPKRIRDLPLYEAVRHSPTKGPSRPQKASQAQREEQQGKLSTRSITSLLDGLQKPSV
ncbi:hypothetical protein [Streptomyces sp. Ac-502]|uniref:hypothetical protein n=1 Tax=Streptomyces sp. Ac-502 TaxID=3342801 RepID=UPI0038621E27